MGTIQVTINRVPTVMAGKRKFVLYSMPVLTEYCFKKWVTICFGELRLKDDKDSHKQYFAVLSVHTVAKQMY